MPITAAGYLPASTPRILGTQDQPSASPRSPPPGFHLADMGLRQRPGSHGKLVRSQAEKPNWLGKSNTHFLFRGKGKAQPPALTIPKGGLADGKVLESPFQKANAV